MWISVLQVVVCVAAIIHVASPQKGTRPPTTTSSTIYTYTTPRPRQYCCSDAPCLGRCIRGYCPYGYKPLPSAFCRCPSGSRCCKLPPKPPCEQCNSMYRCVEPRVACANPVFRKDCNCPGIGAKCCKGPFCYECGGKCIKGSSCKPPFYPMPPGSNCPCPKGMSCCKEAKCESTCKPSKCVSLNSVCNHPVSDPKCTCPSDRKCCKYTCEAYPCNSLCIKGACPPHMNPPRIKYLCTCPGGYKCCQGKCPTKDHKTTTPAECKQLGGWVIPATQLPTGQVCCKLPTCEKNCKAFKAQCARKATCRYVVPALIARKCECPPGKVCCKYTCELSGCNGRCIRGPCLTGMKEKPRTCTCPVGFSCCVSPCPYAPCIPRAKCARHDGVVIPSLHCPKNLVCCKGTCRCPYKQCTELAECRKSGGDPIPSSNCRDGRVCCHFGATPVP